MVTIRDVAKESGFSATTVSIVLNNAPLARYIPTTTKKRIESAAKRLGYRPNLFARSLRSRRSHTVGVMVFDMTDPFCTLVLRGIESSLYQASYLPILTDVQNERARFERYLEMLLDRRVEALIVVANWLFVNIDVLGDLEKSNIPTVMIGRELKNDSISSVIVDNELGGLHRGRTSLCARASQNRFYPRPQDFDRQRPALARRSRLRQGARAGTRSAAHGRSARIARSHVELSRSATNSPKRCSNQSGHSPRLMAFDDMTAFGAIRALSRAGLRVPEQCSVVGFDDIAASNLCTPPLTTIRQPMEAMGAMAASIVLEGINAMLEKRDLPAVHRKLAPELAVRDSTRGPG